MAKNHSDSTDDDRDRLRSSSKNRHPHHHHHHKSKRKSEDLPEPESNVSSGSDHEIKGSRGHKKEKTLISRKNSRRSYSDDEESDSDSDSESESETGSSEYSSDDSEEEERRRRRRKRKRREERERKRKREKEKKRKKRKGRDDDDGDDDDDKKKKKKKKKQKKKDKKKEKMKVGAVTDSWGKYGIIRETDMWNKRPEFTAWLAEVKQVNLESMPNWEEKQMFKQFMEDHNTATFPSKKYYSLDAYHRKKIEKAIKKGSTKAAKSERVVFNDEEQRRIIFSFYGLNNVCSVF
ncbi:uncharacterized protein [Rutidosis leptorrhynchoides]|uniref:uncharacterized protein isoform X2 n=1 Tax=Rutidosis leptorrhynchoides TaxID=125765 RepID=UPI003A99191F